MNRDVAYLRHILDATVKIESYVSVGRDTFMKEFHWHDAVIRELEIIGEATKRLSDKFRGHHPEIPWRRIAGLRDVLIHDYMGVDLSSVWEVTKQHIPDLKHFVEVILSSKK